ncbi:hypothetical protein [Halomarina litorea]|uniref:hypothetical protein n=1 Tax=Halomarina litorea TaxID=2961595 RepID=UPI0020C24759|nr:hypothetical protein [Halomarina sp. BCD28]
MATTTIPDSAAPTRPAPTTANGTDHPVVRWFLLDGDRRVVALSLSFVVLVVLVVAGTVWELEMERLVSETRAVQTLFNTFLGGIILFVSVVLSINIAVLAQEFGPLRTKQEQIEESLAFQSELEAFVETGVSPAELGEFFLFVLRALRTEATRLRAATGTDTGDHHGEILAFVDGIEAEADLVEERVRGVQGMVSNVLLAGLDYDYAHQIYTARRIQYDYEEELRSVERTALENLTELLTFFATGREYFTTLYFKREVRNLSFGLLVVSLPTIVFTSYTLLAIDAGQFPALTVPGIAPRLLWVSVAYVVALSPYVLLSSYILRILTVSKRSLGSSAFTVRTE